MIKRRKALEFLFSILIGLVLVCSASGKNSNASAKTGVWWHWMGSHVSKEGIVKDLDWFAEVGIGSATIFGMCDICTPWASKIDNPPNGKIIAFGPEWWALVRFACDEAEKRNIELGLHNCPGYTSTGGPWIPSRLAMRELVFNVTNVEEQISLEAHAMFPVENGDTGAFEKPKIPARHTDIADIAVVDGVKIQHIPMGAFTQPNQWEIFGLECDKMNPEAVEFHLDHVIGDMKKYLGRHVGKTMKFVLLDSYEAGRPTWTPKMREEFKTRRGYDPLPFLPVLGGFKTTAAPTESDEKKFKDDYELTIRELYRDVLFKIMHEKLNSAGLEFACEPYGGPFDSRDCARYVDRVMTEFWFIPKKVHEPIKPLDWNTWAGPDGKRHNVIEAEAFTASPSNCRWNETPFMLKAAADAQFLRGINRMILHTCPHQPWGDDVLPGKAMGRWGTHFGRNQTWAKSGKGFFEYLNRCQASLQWGEPSAAKLTLKGITPSSVPVESIAREASDEYRFFVVNRSMKSVDFKAVFEKSGFVAGWYDPVSGRDMPLKMVNGEIPLTLAPCGSGFLKLRKIQRRSAQYSMWSDYMQGLISFDSLSSKEIKGDWKLSFGEKTIVTNELIDWTKSEDDDLKYFSGTAAYSIKFNMPEGGREKILNLGDCNNQIAKVILNGKELATLWCAPYEVSLPSGALAEGENELRIEFTNVWANRLIGDEQEISDCDFVEAPIVGGTYLKSFPKWFNGSVKNRPSKGRRCFTDWNYFTEKSKLAPSGLLGPVRISSDLKSHCHRLPKK